MKFKGSNLIVHFLTCILLFICACTSTTQHRKQNAPLPTQKTDQKGLQEFQAALKSYKAGDSRQALARLKKFLAGHPNSDLSPRAHRMMGQIYFDSQDYTDSYNHYLEADKYNTPDADTSLREALAATKIGKTDEAADIVEHMTQRTDLQPQMQTAVYNLRYEIALQKQKNLDALSSLIFLSEHAAQAYDRDKAHALALEFINGRLSEDELRKVADGKNFSFLQIPAKFRYATLMADQKNYDRSRTYFGEVVESAQGTEIAERAKRMLVQMDARDKVDPKTIGVVLPLSGKRAVVGYKTLHGIQLGLGIYGKVPSSFKLAVIDSEANPETARKAVERLVMEDNVIAIIGGVESKTAAVEAAKAQEYGVPFVALSPKSGLTEIGDTVFRNALTGSMLTERLVNVAMTQLHLNRFAILYPNDAYGVEYANLFWDEVRAHGGEIAAVQSYAPKESDFGGAIQRLVGTYYSDDRADEYKLRYKAWEEKNPKRNARTEVPTPQKLLPPIVDFDAIFIPDSASALASIAAYLPYYDVEKVYLLGTNVWNNPSILTNTELKKVLDYTIFVDGFLSTDHRFQTSEFYSNFKQAFDEEPGVFEIQGYDAALMLRQVLTGGEHTRSGLAQRLAKLKNFAGALSPLSMSPSREIQRPVMELRIQDGKITPLTTAASE